MRNTSGVQSVERAFAILQAIGLEPGGLGVTSISKQTGLPKSTVSRLLSTLEASGAIERVPGRDAYRVGPGVLAMAGRASYSRQLNVLARPYLQELAEETGETVHLCTPDGDQVFYVDQINSRFHIQLQDWTGVRFPMHTVAAGRVFLASLSPDRLEQYLSRPLERYTSKAITDRNVLRRHVERARAEGLSWVWEETELGLVGVAAPVEDAGGKVVAAVSLVGPAFRFPPPGRHAEMAADVTHTARLIAQRVQGPP